MKNIEKKLKERVEARGFTLEDLTSEEIAEARQETISLCEGKAILDSVLDNPRIRMRIWAKTKE